MSKTSTACGFVIVSSLSCAAWADNAPTTTTTTTTITKVQIDDCTVLPQPGSPCAMSGRRAVTIRVARIGVELVLATLLGAALGAGGAYIGLNADLAGGNESGAGLALGASFGVALGVAPGVWLGGLAMGGDGSFGWTLLASAAGTALSAGILAIDSKPGLLVLGAAIPLSSAILAYELSSHTKKRSKAAAPTTGKVFPAVGPTFVGVVGSF